nr:ATP-binding cassette domain-containing protein [Chloroflexota bacterium]
MLEAKNLVKKYGDFTAVNGVSLAVGKGEIVGLLGPNGAGKTTTLSMLSCLLEPTSGTAAVAGFDVCQQPGEVKKHIGLVPQDLALYPTLSARDNLSFFGRIYHLRGADLKARIDWALELVGLADRARDPIQTFSGGMKRRINIAASLLHRPDVLFLDEPTVGVDPQSRNAIFDNVERLNREGMTILYTTHYMEEAQRLCHRVAIVDQGRIVALDTPRALIDSLGGGIIHLGLANGRGAAVLERARALPGVHSATQTDGRIEIRALRAQQALIGVLDAANQLDATVTSLEILQPNLETVFLQLTGKHLRD